MHARNPILLTLGTANVLLAACVTDALAQSCSSTSSFSDLLDAERLHISFRDVAHAQTLLNGEINEASQNGQKDAVAQHQMDLGLLYGLEQNYGEAKNLCEQSLATRKTILGIRDISVAESFNALALIALETQDTATAEQYLQEAIAIAQANPEKGTLHLADSYDLQARMALEQGNFEKAEDPAFKSFHIRSTVLGINHPAVAQSTYILALYNAAKGNVPRAFELLDESIAHADSIQKIKSMFAKSRLVALQANPQESRTLFAQALDLRKAVLGSYANDVQSKSQFAKFLWNHSMWLDAMEIRKALPLHVNAIRFEDPDTRLLTLIFDRSDIPTQFNPNYIYAAVSLILIALGLIGVNVFMPQFLYMPGGTGLIDFLRTNRRNDLNRTITPQTKMNSMKKDGNLQTTGNQTRVPRSQTSTNSNLSLIAQRDSKPVWTPDE